VTVTYGKADPSQFMFYLITSYLFCAICVNLLTDKLNREEFEAKEEENFRNKIEFVQLGEKRIEDQIKL
jgi:hypothetical protein